MAGTGTRFTTALVSDAVVLAAVRAGGIVIVDMRQFCTVFVSHEDAPTLVAQGWEETVPGAVAGFYTNEDKGVVIKTLREALPRKPILTWE